VFQAQTQGYKESKSEETLPVVLKMVMLYVTKLSFTKVEFGLNHVDIFASVM